MGLAPARTTGGNLVSIGVAKARILFLHMLGMGRAKRLLPLLRTGFAPALASIRGGTLCVERVQGLDTVAGRAGFHGLTGFACVNQAVRMTVVAIKLVERLVLATGLAPLHHDVAAIALPR